MAVMSDIFDVSVESYDGSFIDAVLPAENVFCPTGPGGGVNPSCGKHDTGEKLARVAESSPHEYTKLQLAKIAAYNPNGASSGKVVVPNSLTDDHVKYLTRVTGAKVERAVLKDTKELPDERGAGVARTAEGTSGQVAGAGGSAPAGSGDQPHGGEAPSGVPASREEVDRKLDRYSKFFSDRGQHEVVSFLDSVRSHVAEFGTEESLKSLGAEVRGKGEAVQYAGHDLSGKSDAAFIEAYLERHGISLVNGGTPAGEKRAVSTVAPSSDETGTRARGDTRDVFPALQGLRDKLHESQHLPGLESSEDMGKLMGKEFGSRVERFSPEVLSKLDATYGEGKWIVKSYGDEAYAGYGIFFPQRVSQVTKDAKDAVWASGQELAKYGFKHLRDGEGTVVGIKHRGGEEYRFGTEKYERTIDGAARAAADSAAAAAPDERHTSLPKGSFMAQPAFPVVGISNEERAAGVTFKQGQEGRVHITTKDGVASVVPHSTWLKLESMPVVFENDDTRAMAKAALGAINALPKSERHGQLYAPDIVKTADGYKVVEANPANEAGASGYLQDNPLIIDSYVSHIVGREPAHVAFVRKLLSATHNAFCPTGSGGGVDPSCTKFVGAKVGKAEQIRAAEIEAEVAKVVGGKLVPRVRGKQQAHDVEKPGHDIEVKSLLVGSKNRLSVHPDAIHRKALRQEATGNVFHTIAVDDRPGAEHRLYYKRGSGRYSLSQMHQARSATELKRLIASSDDELPAAARGQLPKSADVAEAAGRAHISRYNKDRDRMQRLKANVLTGEALAAAAAPGLTEMQLAKIAAYNPNGASSGRIVVPAALSDAHVEHLVRVTGARVERAVLRLSNLRRRVQ